MVQPAAIELREIAPADLPALLELYRAAGLVGPSSFTVAEAGEQLVLLARYPYYRVFVALLDGELVGSYELLLMDNMAKRGAKSAIVEDVAVHPAVQKRGIGKQMMAHAREQARRHGAYKLVLSSNDRRIEAHAFYEALGFARHGVSFLVQP